MKTIHGWIVMLVLVGFAGGAITPARADDVYTFVVKKQEDKQISHWSLAEWLATRDRMRLMDMWLALHTPSPYEFFIAGAYTSGSPTGGGTNYSSMDVSAAAFASIFGLEFKRESSPVTRLSAMFDLRIFGFHDQDTNITLQGGLRSQDVGALSQRNAFFGTRLNIYLGRYFGLEGLYRHFYTSSLGTTPPERFEGGALIDFKFFRVFGDYFSELGTQSGFTVGGKLYF